MKWIGMFFCLTFLVAFYLMIPPADAAAETYESFIRLHPHGPPGVGMKGDEKEKEHVYYTSPTNEVISAGVWEAAPHTAGPKTLKYSEFMYVLDGSVTLVDAQGRKETFKAGEAVLAPRGVEIAWQQTEPIRKYWVIFDVTPAEGEQRPSSVIRLDPSVELKGEGRGKEHMYYAAKADEERINVGVWEAPPQASPPADFFTPETSEFVYVLEGSVTLEDKSGRKDTFKAGDAFIIPRDMSVKWIQPEHLKEFWLYFDPAPEAGTDEPE
jgi:uncharacterized cupin superfamily protein